MADPLENAARTAAESVYRGWIADTVRRRQLALLLQNSGRIIFAGDDAKTTVNKAKAEFEGKKAN